MGQKAVARLRTVKTDSLEWTHVSSTNKETIAKLRTLYRFHPLDLRDIEPPLQRPKVVVRDGYLFMILLYPVFDKKTKELRVSEVDFFIAKDHLITVNTDHLQALDSLFHSCSKTSTKKQHVCLSGDISQLLYAILNDLMSAVYPKIVRMQADMDELETELKDISNKKLISDILRLKLNVMNARQAMQGHKNVMPKLLEIAPEYFVLDGLKIYYDELVRDSLEVWDALELQKETIEAIHETNKTLIDFHTNDIIKTLTIFSVIVFPLTLLAAMFGMNVPVPFDHHPHGFWLITGIMLAGSFAMLLYFKHKKWI